MKNITKKIAILYFLIVYPVLSYAEEKSIPSTTEQCTEVELLANTIMTVRQAGVSMSKIMKSLNAVEAISEHDILQNELGTALIVEAYEMGRFSDSDSGESYKKRAIEDFGNKAFLTCFKALSK
jgi:hypothetical protein